MTTETVHSPGGVDGASCGAPFTADMRFTAKPSKVTCPACLTAMGGGSVVSGLDTAAATAPPAKPTAVAVGQRWRDGRGRYTVVEHSPPAPGSWSWPWKLRYDDGLPSYAGASILTDEYLGTVPAPVETPPTEPVKPDELCPRRQRPRKATAEGVCCWNTGGPYCVPRAAPAPGVGEGPRELTFAEACELRIRDEDAALDVYIDGHGWEPSALMKPNAGHYSLLDFVRLSKLRYRRRPEPLPAPAPRVSRVQELADMYLAGTQDRVRAVGLAVLAAEETLDTVLREWVKGGKTADILDRARTAMLEPPACPGRRP